MVRFRDALTFLLVMIGIGWTIYALASGSADASGLDKLIRWLVVIAGLTVLGVLGAFLAARHSGEPPPRPRAPELPTARARTRRDD